MFCHQCTKFGVHCLRDQSKPLHIQPQTSGIMMERELRFQPVYPQSVLRFFPQQEKHFKTIVQEGFWSQTSKFLGNFDWHPASTALFDL